MCRKLPQIHTNVLVSERLSSDIAAWCFGGSLLWMTVTAQLDLSGLSVVHVTGTKGKGSTCAMVESILRHHGFKTGKDGAFATNHFYL